MHIDESSTEVISFLCFNVTNVDLIDNNLETKRKDRWIFHIY